MGKQAAKDSPLPEVFFKTYDQLRENLHHPVGYSVTHLQNTAKATLDCAGAIMADMILVNPKSESGTLGIAGYRHLSDLLQQGSWLQVLDVEP